MDNRAQKAKEIRDAIQRGDVLGVATLIDDDRDILNMMTPFGTWLHVAATFGKLEIVKRLVEMGIDVNMRGGTFGGNALNSAASAGHVEVVEYLFSHGAKLDVSEPERNPLFGAIHGGHLNVAEFLISKGIDQKIKYTGSSMNNMDALAFAIERGQKEIATVLRKK